MAQMKGKHIIRTCMENSSLCKALSSNEVVSLLENAKFGDEGYDLSRVSSWIAEVTDAVEVIYKRWEESGVPASVGTVEEYLRGTEKMKQLIKDDYPKGSPLCKVSWWVSEVAKQMANAYTMWQITRGDYERAVM